MAIIIHYLNVIIHYNGEISQRAVWKKMNSFRVSKCHFYFRICVLVSRQGQSLPSSDRVWDHTLPRYQCRLLLQARLPLLSS